MLLDFDQGAAPLPDDRRQEIHKQKTAIDPGGRFGVTYLTVKLRSAYPGRMSGIRG